jgi:hypothetical protein
VLNEKSAFFTTRPSQATVDAMQWSFSDTHFEM